MIFYTIWANLYIFFYVYIYIYVCVCVCVLIEAVYFYKESSYSVWTDLII